MMSNPCRECETSREMTIQSRMPLLCAVLLMLLLALLLPARAQATATVTIDGTTLTKANYYKTTATGRLQHTGTPTDYNVWFDEDNNTLRLNNATITHSGPECTTIRNDDLTIALSGNSTMHLTNYSQVSRSLFGIWTAGSLTFNGTGSLSVTTTTQNSSNDSYGIYTSGYLTVESGASVTCAVDGRGRAIRSSAGAYAVSTATVNGSLTATGGRAGGESYGVYARAGTTIEGTVIATAGTSTGSSSFGIFTNDAFNASGTVIATGGTASVSSYGLYASHISGASGTVVATGGAASVSSYGIHAPGGINMDGALTGIGGTATTGSSYGMHVNPLLDITVFGGALVGYGQARAFTKQPVINNSYTSAWAWLGDSAAAALATSGTNPAVSGWYSERLYTAIGQRATGITANPTTLTLFTGDVAPVAATLTSGTSAAVGAVTWTATGDGSATVAPSAASNSATVTAVKAGTTTLTVSVPGAQAPVTVTIRVYDRSTGLTLTPGVTSLTTGSIGNTGTIIAELLPVGANQTLSILSSDTNIFTVERDSYNAQSNRTSIEIKAGSATGTATLIVTTWDHLTATATVNVATPISVQSVSLSPATQNLRAYGATGTLTATVNPGNATDQALHWQSSDDTIVTVNPSSGSAMSATLTPLAPGTATITVTTNDGGFQATAMVIVAQPVGGAPPQTGDGTPIGLLLGLCAGSGILAGVLSARRKRLGMK